MRRLPGGQYHSERGDERPAGEGHPMKRGSAKIVLGQIQTLYTLGTLGGLSETQLLELFLTRGEDVAEDAFTALVHRHGPMVLGVCRRMLPNAHDAEDAFQATFLILARRAASIGRREQLANWLYGVAVRTAKEARRRAARQHARERRLMNVSHVEVEKAPGEDQADLLSLLDEELNALPPRYRIALVACELEGKSRREAAHAARTARGHPLDPPGSRSEAAARALAPARRQPGSRAVRRAGAAHHNDHRPRAAGRFHGSCRTRLCLGRIGSRHNPGYRRVIGRRSAQDDVGDEVGRVDRIPGGRWPDRGRHRGRSLYGPGESPIPPRPRLRSKPKMPVKAVQARPGESRSTPGSGPRNRRRRGRKVGLGDRGAGQQCRRSPTARYHRRDRAVRFPGRNPSLPWTRSSWPPARTVRGKGWFGMLYLSSEAKLRHPVQIVLKPAQEIAVRVLDRDGKPVPDAVIAFLTERHPVANGRTDADGRMDGPCACRQQGVVALRPQSQGGIRLRGRRRTGEPPRRSCPCQTS